MSVLNWTQTRATRIEVMRRRFDLDPDRDAETGSGAETGLDTGLDSKLDKGLDLDSIPRLRLRTVAQVCFVFTLHSTHREPEALLSSTVVAWNWLPALIYPQPTVLADAGSLPL